MDPRARLLTALARGIPDRVPVSTYELVGYDSLAWENNSPSYASLMRLIRERTDCVCMWNPASNETFLGSSHAVDLEVSEERAGGATTVRRTLHTPRGTLTQTTRVMGGVHTTWQTEHWCKSSADVDRLLSIPYQPARFDASDFGRIRMEVGERGIIMASVSDPLYLAADLMAFGDYTVWAMSETQHFGRTIAQLHERVMGNLERMLTANVVDLYRICGPEYATPPFLPPRFFADFVRALRYRNGGPDSQLRCAGQAALSWPHRQGAGHDRRYGRRCD